MEMMVAHQELFSCPIINYRCFIQMRLQHVDKGLMVRVDQIVIAVFVTGKCYKETMRESLV